MPRLLFDRRHIVRGMIAAPALLLHGRALAARDPFALGVASGEPAPDGFVIWTRIAPDPLAEDGFGGNPAPLPVRWEVATDDSFHRIVMHGEAMARPELASAVHVEISGLQPERPYHYRFIANGLASPIGKAWTAPRATATPGPLRFTAATCSHWELGYFAAYRHMAAEEDSRLTLFLGDYIYETTATGERRKQTIRSYGMGPAFTLADYRRRYALHRTDPDLRQLHAAAACIATWDDHEVQNDYSGIWPQDIAVTPAAFVARRTAAYRAFCENMPVRLSRVMRADGSFRLNRRLRWGTLAQFDVLDGRQFRSPGACADGAASRSGHMAPLTCPDLEDPSRTFLGFEQERWLYDGWTMSPAHWNIAVQNLLVAPLTIDMPEGQSLWTDTWNGFGAARRRLLDAMVSTKLANPVMLAGDYHSFWCNDLRQDFSRPADPAVAAEFVVSSITSNGPPEQAIRAALPANLHVRFFDAAHRGYLSVDLSQARMDTRCMAISDRADRDASVRILHAQSVEAGRPGLA